jgi:uncharacterized protein (TIGR02421 family)
MPEDPTRLAELDRALVDAAKGIKVLSALSWPESAATEFLESVQKRRPKLPAPLAATPISDDIFDRLRVIMERCDRADPLQRFIHDTAYSYRKIAELISSVGSPNAHAISREVYGGPEAKVPGASFTHLEAADRLLEATAALTAATREEAADYCITSTDAITTLKARIAEVFKKDAIDVVIDTKLSAKAAASASRIRLRGDVKFSEQDVQQLVEHELMVHTLTAINGRAQPFLTSLSLGSPRTTATQEGLATFAELITGSIDLARLRRLALRVRAIRHAENGADFIELFRYLVDLGEPEIEAVHTAMRVFRGGDPRGRWVFTKDVVYLRGLLEVHTFLRKAIAERRPELVRRMFVGRLTLGDVVRLEECFENGAVAGPRHLPRWAKNIRGLAAFLSFSALINMIDLKRVLIDDFQTGMVPNPLIQAG